MARSSWAAGPRSVPATLSTPPSRAGSEGAVSAPMAPVSRAGVPPSSSPSVSYSPTAPGPLAVPGTCSTMSSAQVPVSKGSGSASGAPPGVAAVGSSEGSSTPSAACSSSASARSGALTPSRPARSSSSSRSSGSPPASSHSSRARRSSAGTPPRCSVTVGASWGTSGGVQGSFSSRASARSSVGAASGPASMSVEPTRTSSPAGEAGSVSCGSSTTSRSPRSTWSSLTTEVAYSSASCSATVASSGEATVPSRTTSSSRVATSIRSSSTRVDTPSRSRICSSTSRSTAIGIGPPRGSRASLAGRAPLPWRRPRESAGALPLQAGLLDVQVVEQAAGHLGRDPALVAQAAQLLPLGPEQVRHQLGVGPGAVAPAVLALLAQVGQAGPVALAQPLDQLGRDAVGLGVDRVQAVQGDLRQPGQGLAAVAGRPLVVGRHPQPADHQGQGQALADQGDHDHREGQEHHQVAVGEGLPGGHLGRDGHGEGQGHHP